MTSANGKGVIFDLDGVLVDTGAFHKQSWYDLAEKEGFLMTEEFFFRTFGMQNAQIIPMLAGKEMSAAEVEQLSVWKEQRYRELIAGQLSLLEGVRELLADLRKNNFSLAVGTSTPRVNLDFMLEQTDSQGIFDAAATSEDVACSKPAPDTFLKAAEKLNLSPQRCIVVEDAIPGIRAGKAAGMAVIAVTTTRPRTDLHEADLIVDSMKELKAVDFERLLAVSTQ